MQTYDDCWILFRGSWLRVVIAETGEKQNPTQNRIENMLWVENSDICFHTACLMFLNVR